METIGSVDDNNPPDIFEFKGTWDSYEEELYEIFNKTICEGSLTFQGQRISIKRHPEYKEKHFTFWHITSEGEREAERIPDLRRCERIRWVSWLISNCETNPEITYWENKRGSEKHIVIWSEQHQFAVILARRNGYFLLKTAYVVSKRRAEDFIKERKNYYKKSK